MSTQLLEPLESEIVRFLHGQGTHAHDLVEIVRRFRTSADDSDIKAALLRLSIEGLVEITPNWEFRLLEGQC